MNVNKSEEILGFHGIRPTPVRILVLTFIGRTSFPVSALDIETGLDTVDRSSISRTLVLFMEKGLLHSTDDGSGSVKYEMCRSCAVTEPHDHMCESNFSTHTDLHVHFHCCVCGKTECLPEAGIPAVSLPKDYVVTGANFVISGVCSCCVRKRQI